MTRVPEHHNPIDAEPSAEQGRQIQEAERAAFATAAKNVGELLRQDSIPVTDIEYDPESEAVNASIAYIQRSTLGSLVIKTVHRRDYLGVPVDPEAANDFWHRPQADIQTDLDGVDTAKRTHDLTIHPAEHPLALGYQLKVASTLVEDGEWSVDGALIGIPDKTEASYDFAARPTTYKTPAIPLVGSATTFRSESIVQPEDELTQRKLTALALEGIGFVAAHVRAQNPEAIESYISDDLVPSLAQIKAETEQQ
jgi:hypothetical protein